MLYDAHELGRTFLRGQVPVRALDRVSLRIDEGEFVAVTGPSGCGKTTLLNILGLLDPDHEGRLEMRGRSVSGLAPRETARLRLAAIGLVFQDFHLVPALDALDNVAMPHWRLHGSRARARKRAAELLGSLGLGDRLRADTQRLSGGEMQRVAVARSLVNDPAVVLADEPTANLDAEATSRLLDLLDGVHRDGRAVVIVSHNPTVVARAGRAIRLEYGRMAAEG
ncbi:MAG: ABC transporter ATP-binding protein [Deltaproteobacteria bacterium]|nr:ABC transporter ATP-binding protein [Deltaproteobacteria bacterium]